MTFNEEPFVFAVLAKLHTEALLRERGILTAMLQVNGMVSNLRFGIIFVL